MKVLLIDVYHYNRGGAETVCFNTGRLLQQHGHDVVYFCLKWKRNLPSPFEHYFPESKETRRSQTSPTSTSSGDRSRSPSCPSCVATVCPSC